MRQPDHTRHARAAAAAIGAAFEDLDSGQGSLYRICRGGRHVVLGAGSVPAYPLNDAAAFAVARDKAYAKAALQASGVPVIEGRLFFATSRRAMLRAPGREAGDAAAYAAHLGWPVFAKPNTGSRGDFAEIIEDEGALVDYIGRVGAAYEAFLIERFITGAEHRVLVKDGRVRFAVCKSPPTLTGDGRSSLRRLVEDANDALAGRAISRHTLSVLTAGGLNPDHVPPAGERIPLAGRRNLSSEGEVGDLTLTPDPALADLACRAARAVGLRLAGVDVFETSASDGGVRRVVIEINGNPGLKSLELAGREDLIHTLWVDLLEEALGRADPG